MKTTHTFGIQFILRTGKKDKTQGIVYARIIVEARRAELPPKKHIAVDDWNNVHGIAKNSSLESLNFSGYKKLSNAINVLPSSPKRLTNVSTDFGYFGQSHFINEFKYYMDIFSLEFLSLLYKKNKHHVINKFDLLVI